MRLKGPSHSFHPPTGVHSSRGSHVYTFINGAADDSSSEEEFDVGELRARGGELQRQHVSRERVGDVVLLERPITEDDSLNKLALLYGCKVSDIKRVNNFLTEQDMYALKIIKIPVKVHSIFTEQNEEPGTQNSSSSHSHGTVSEQLDDSCVTSMDNKDISQYFREIDQNIEEAVQNQEVYSGSFGSGNGQITSIPRQKDSYLGADWGIRWWNAVLIMLLIGIILPVFYIIYYEKGAEKSSHSANVTEGQTNASVHSKDY